MAERDPRYFKVYQDGDDRELEQKIQQIVESGAAPGIDMVARENIEEIQRKIDNGEIGGGGGGAGVDEQARQEIQEVSEQLADTVKEVNGVKPTNGKVILPIPEVDTTNLATKTDIQQLSLTFKESYATLSALQTAYPNGDNTNHVVLADKMIYTYKNGWVSTEIQGVGTGAAEKSIMPKHTTFIEQSENLFNKDDSRIILNKYISGGAETAGNNYFISPKYPVKPGEKYVVTLFNGISKYTIAHSWTKDGVYINYIPATDSGNHRILTVPNDSNIAFMTFNGQIPVKDTAMLVKGEVYPSEFKPYFPAKLSNSFSLNDTQKEEVRNLIPPQQTYRSNLYEKKALYNGDSICAGDGWPLNDENGTRIKTGYAKVISDKNSMTTINYAIGGGTIAAETYTSGGKAKHWICRTIADMDSNADYIIFEGGINDIPSTPKGTITEGYTATLDDRTFCGALESIFKQALLKWQGKKIGFIIVHKSYSLEHQILQNEYWELARQICRKWSIPYLDLFYEGGVNVNIPEINNTYFYNADKVHPNERGYREYLAPKIEAWISTL